MTSSLSVSRGFNQRLWLAEVSLIFGPFYWRHETVARKIKSSARGIRKIMPLRNKCIRLLLWAPETINFLHWFQDTHANGKCLEKLKTIYFVTIFNIFKSLAFCVVSEDIEDMWLGHKIGYPELQMNALAADKNGIVRYNWWEISVRLALCACHR